MTYPEPLENFKEGQWWTKELDALKELPGASLDQKRAVAVVHHMLKAADAHCTEVPKRVSEADVHKAIKPFLTRKQQGYVMGALREIIPMYNPRSGPSREGEKDDTADQ